MIISITITKPITRKDGIVIFLGLSSPSVIGANGDLGNRIEKLIGRGRNSLWKKSKIRDQRIPKLILNTVNSSMFSASDSLIESSTILYNHFR